jgi:hypothetical protein
MGKCIAELTFPAFDIDHLHREQVITGIIDVIVEAYPAVDNPLGGDGAE